MKRSLLEQLAFLSVAALLIGGLVLFGCNRSEPDPEATPHEQQNGHDHGAHAHDE